MLTVFINFQHSCKIVDMSRVSVPVLHISSYLPSVRHDAKLSVQLAHISHKPHSVAMLGSLHPSSQCISLPYPFEPIGAHTLLDTFRDRG